MTLKALTEKRERLQAEMEQLLNTAEVEQRAMSEEETARFDALETEIRAVDRTLERAEKARKADIKLPAGETVEERARAESEMFSDYIKGKKTENRASLTEGENGGIVPLTVANRIIERVKAQVPFFTYADLAETKGKYSIPVYEEDGENAIVADYVTEGTALTDNIGKIKTIDLNGYVIGGLSLVGQKLITNTDVNVTDFVVRKMSEALAAKLNTEFTSGSAKIKGILEAKNIITAAAQAAVTYDELVSLRQKIPQRYRTNGVWIMHPDTYAAILKLKNDMGEPYFKISEKILNSDVIESEDMPSLAAGNKAIIFADLSGYSIKGAKGVEVQVLRERFAEKYMLGIMGFAEYDGAISNQQKFAVLQMHT